MEGCLPRTNRKALCRRLPSRDSPHRLPSPSLPCQPSPPPRDRLYDDRGQPLLLSDLPFTPLTCREGKEVGQDKSSFCPPEAKEGRKESPQRLPFLPSARAGGRPSCPQQPPRF